MQKLKFKFNIQLFATEEEAKQNEIEEKENDNNQYIEALAEMKKNSVSKEEYEKLQEENKKMLQAMIDGEQITIESPKADVDTNERIKTLHKEMFSTDCQLTNLEYCQKALELRELIIDRDGEDADPFLPHSHNYLITDSDREASKRVAKELQDAIDKANGSAQVFTATLQDKLVDITLPQKNKRR